MMHTMKDMIRTVTEEIVTTYRMIRSNEALATVQLCGFTTTFDLWSFEQRGEIVKALNRGKEGRHRHALERFGYLKTRTTKNGVWFHHNVFPNLYAPLTLHSTTNIFTEWPAELINQIYLNDVVLYKRAIASKAKLTRCANATARKRARDEEVPATSPKHVRMEEEEEDEWSYGF